MTTTDIVTLINAASDASEDGWDAAVDSAESEGDAERAAAARSASDECAEAYQAAVEAAVDTDEMMRRLEEARGIEAAWGDDSCARGLLRRLGGAS